MSALFGQRMRELMRTRGVSLRELSRRTYYDKAHLSRVLNGHKPASPGLARRLDEELDAAGALSALVDERLALAVQEPRRVDTASLDAVTSMLASIRHLEDSTSAADVLPTVQGQLGLIERMAANARVQTRRKVVGLAAEISQYLGWLHIPLNRWQRARRHLDRAAVLAMEADDPDRLATALSFRAYHAIRLGDWLAAADLSEAAARDDRVHAGLRTYIAYQRAEVLARRGGRHEAQQLLGVADRLVDRLPPPAELPPSGYWYVPAFFLGQRGFVLRALGEVHAAREAGRAALEAMPATWRNAEWAHRRRQLAED